MTTVEAADAPARKLSEEGRWTLFFGGPLLAAAAFFALALGSGLAWVLAPAILCLGVAIVVLPWLAMSSCTIE